MPYNIKKKKTILISVLFVLIAGLAYYFYNLSQPNPKQLENSEAIGQITKGNPIQESSDSENSNDDSAGEVSDEQNNPDDPKKVNPSTGTLKTPTGNFVSSHEGLQMDSVVASSCVTSPGATCTIRFTSKGITKSLREQTTDREGATFWEWTPKQIGLTSGEWTIEAVATSGSATKTAQDALTLRIE